MSSSSGSTIATTGSLAVAGNLSVAGTITSPGSSHPHPDIPVLPPQPPAGPPPPDAPTLPPVPFPQPIEALGGFVGPYFQAGHTTVSAYNGDYFPVCGPFYTPGVMHFSVILRKKSELAVDAAQRGIIYGSIGLYWHDALTTNPIGPSSTGAAAGGRGGAGAILPAGARRADGTEITDANPIPVGSQQMMMRVLNGQASIVQEPGVFEWQGFGSIADVDAEVPVPCYMPMAVSLANVDQMTFDVSWTFTPSAGFDGQVVPLPPVPASYTKARGAAAVAAVPPAWAAGQTYPPGYVVISPQSPSASPPITTPTYWQATSQIVNPSTAGNQPGTQGSLTPAVQWIIFGSN